MNKAMQLKAKIKNLAQTNHVPAQAVLQNYMLERLLERIALSRFNEYIILKGGMLIASMVGIQHRTTMDMDTTLRGYPLTEEKILDVFIEICAIPLNDGVSFQLENIIPIREEDEYGGFRMAIIAKYETVIIPLKIDITTGDVITPQPIQYFYHSNFEEKTIKIWAYNVETILAEKIETIFRRSVLNTRLRDFYDAFLIVKNYNSVIDKEIFIAALNATSKKRGSDIALQDKDKILLAIQSDSILNERWKRYCDENFYAKDIQFTVVIEAIKNISRDKK